jgi:hypothetical protein
MQKCANIWRQACEYGSVFLSGLNPDHSILNLSFLIKTNLLGTLLNGEVFHLSGSVFDLNLDRIRIQWSPWIRIHIQEGKNENSRKS